MRIREKIILAALAFTSVASCKKNLDIEPSGLVTETTLANRKGVEGLLVGAYSLLDGFATDLTSGGWGGAGSNWTYGSICGSEAYEGSFEFDGANFSLRPLETFTADPRNDFLVSKWQTVYAGVQRANEVLRVMKKATDISDEDRIRITAEARFLRGFYHFEAIKVFHKVPYVDETITYNNGNYFLSNDTLIWPAIENDFRFAMENLPSVMSAAGRVNKFAAEAYLAKAYLFEFTPEKLGKAKPLLEELIAGGVTATGIHYALLEKFNDNFNLATKNSSESVFAAQVSVNDGSAGFNGNFGDILNFPASGDAPGTCCDFFKPSQYLVNHFKTGFATGLPDLDQFNDIDVKSDQGISSSEPYDPYTGTLDPRLDWTAGRREIPYLDWGPHPGSRWSRDQDYGGPYHPLKNVFRKEQKEKFTDPAFWSTGSNANNVNLLRYADILLWAAEVEVEIGSPDKARGYINQLRNRAANQTGWVKNPDGTYSANYKISPYTSAWTSKDEARKAVRYERMLELAMEGHRFFDLVRWGIADQEINAYLAKEKTLRAYMANAIFIKGKHEYFPIPQTQIDLSAGPDGIKKLKQNPGY